jgi:tRNA-2-methylthio-N6-dimethylallyladenosine synthase
MIKELALQKSTDTKRKFYIETYGCQMNFADTEVVNAILIDQANMLPVDKPEFADVIFVNTCSIREKAETTVWNRLKQFRQYKKTNKDLVVGVMGCMAERVRKKIIEQEKLVDIVVGPDAYRTIPQLISEVDDGHKAVNVLLSMEETYADITPVRTTGNGVSAFVSIMRGCDNMCTFCVVPYTRGRERSRPVESIREEVRQLVEDGYKEITLLGQNVNSYIDEGQRLADLMRLVAEEHTEVRFRFSSPHPKDFPDELLHLIANTANVCNYVHMPAQSGNTEVLERMKRPYTREEYLALIDKIRQIIPGVTLSTDIISSFCGETEEQHLDTMSLMQIVGYDMAYMYAYSERERTYAHRKYEDDVPTEDKKRRLTEIIDQQMSQQVGINEKQIGTRHIVLIEGHSKRDKRQLSGRTDTNKVVIFDDNGYEIGDYVEVVIERTTSATLFGTALGKTSIAQFFGVGVVKEKV